MFAGMTNRAVRVEVEDLRGWLCSSDPGQVSRALDHFNKASAQGVERRQAIQVLGLIAEVAVGDMADNQGVKHFRNPFSSDASQALARLGDEGSRALLADASGRDMNRAHRALLGLGEIQNLRINGDSACFPALSEEFRGYLLIGMERIVRQDLSILSDLASEFIRIERAVN